MKFRLNSFIIFIFALTASVSLVSGQVSKEGTPYSFTHSVRNDFEVVTMPDEVDVDILLLEDELAGKDVPLRFGYPFFVEYDMENSGSWETTEDGGKLWRLAIISHGAYSINIVYDDFWLPSGGEFYVYNADQSRVIGAFTDLNNKETGVFATAPVAGDQIILEYYEPASTSDDARIQLSTIIHAYRNTFGFREDRDYGDSGSCNNNVNCPEFADWQNEVRAAAMILSGGGWRLCSGSLINNVRQDMTQYFLTANHCLGGESSWIFMFNYQSPGCQNQDGPTNQTVQGSTLMGNSSGSDFGLLRLTETIPELYNVNYAGWDATGNVPAIPVGIHHPSGDIKKISFDYDNAQTSGSYWRVVDWDDGTTEPGSSGSPLYDGASHRIVGQLYGGYAACSNDDWDEYGKVSVSWNSGLKQYLDPDNTGLMVLDGLDHAAQPELTYSPSSFDVSLEPDQTNNESIIITNTGEEESTLYYSLTVSPFENVGGGPDAHGNLWADSDNEPSISAEWIDISTIGTAYSFPHNDQAGGSIDISFDFPFYGQTYSQCIVNANGWVGFGSDNTAWDNTSIPNSSAPRPAIFGFWDDLNPVNDQCNEYCSGEVYYHSNSERMVITFDEVAHWWTNFENSFYSFQVVLYPSGDVLLNYLSITGTYFATIGMQNAAGSVGLQVSNNSSYVHNDLSVLVTQEPEWVTVDPDQGEVNYSTSETVEVQFTSAGLESGEHTANIILSSNGGTATIPVLMTIEEGGQTSMDVSYMENWNLVGLPLEVEDASCNYLFPESIEGTLYSFDDGYNSESVLTAGEGYWLRFINAGSVAITGSSINELTLSLSADWNLISGISEEISIYSVSDPGNIIVPNTLYSFTEGYTLSEELVPGTGYWLRAFQDGDITLSSGALAKSPPKDYSLKGITNSLTIKGAELYFGIELSDMERLSYSLPPKPPTGAFDARFAGDWNYCNEFGDLEIMNSSELLTIGYTIAVHAGENINWTLQSKSGKKYILEGSGELIIPSEEIFTLGKRPVIPNVYSLHQNYPNPFNPITTLRYDLPEDAIVTLTLYDLGGREVTQLVNTKQNAGYKSINWNATDKFGKPVSAGVYLYQIQAGEFVQTKKMVLLK